MSPARITDFGKVSYGEDFVTKVQLLYQTDPLSACRPCCLARLDIVDVSRGSLISLQNVGHQVDLGELRPYRRGRHRRG